MLEHEGFKVIDMLQRIKRSDGLDIETLRCPIRFDNDIFKSEIAAPTIGQHTTDITKEFNL
jgi:crotonobetainyl-CoA:carnitine CoA-transferase CaiB-like acyl-CoA transferase